MNVQEAVKIVARYELARELRGHAARSTRPSHIPKMHWDRVKTHMDVIVKGLEPEPGQYSEATDTLVADDPDEELAAWLRKALGLGASAAEAREIPHTYQSGMYGDTGKCLACGFTRDWQAHVGATGVSSD